MYRGGEKMARGFNPDDTELWGEKKRETILKCLSCEKEKCTNCLERDRRAKRRYKCRCGGYCQIDAKTGEVIATFESAYDAALDQKVSVHTIYSYIGMKRAVRGYLWKKKSEVEGLV